MSDSRNMNLRMSVFTLMGLVPTHIPFATARDKKTGRVFEIGLFSINLAEVTLDGRVEANQNLDPKFQGALRVPPTDFSDSFRMSAEVIAIRERDAGQAPQSWAFRMSSLTKVQLKKLIASSEMIDPVKGPYIPRFIVAVGTASRVPSPIRGYNVTAKGMLFSSRPAAAKGKGKGAKSALRR